MDKFRWGIIATGKIAASLAEALHFVEDAEPIAVASRTQQNADRFGDTWNIPRRYGSYQQLVEDDDVDVVYIATPHNLHAENMKLCLQAGKHVMCEKPLTINAQEVHECIELARQKDRFLMEAVWMRFFPAIAKVKQLVQDGAIGKPRLVQADFCFQLPFDPQHRLFDLELGGGALLDIGIYPLSFTTLLLGFPAAVRGHAQIGSTGVDEIASMELQYPNQCVAQLNGSMTVYKPQEAFVVGEDGYVKVHESFIHPDRLTLHRNGNQPEEFHIPYLGNGYPHEIEEVHRCLREGLTESPLMPLNDSLKMMELMDQIRQPWGIRYPADQD